MTQEHLIDDAGTHAPIIVITRHPPAVALSNWRATMLKVKDLAGHPLLARFLSLPSKTEPLRKFIECVRFTKSFVTCDQKN
jgi:hypothetical protein